MAITRSTRLTTGVVAAGLFLIPLAGCSGDATDTSVSDLTSAAQSAGSAASSAAQSAGSAASSAANKAGDNVDCSGNSCSVTVSTGADVNVLGTQLSLKSVDNGQATLSVGDQTVSCGEGENVSAGPLRLQCSNIGSDSITLTASLG